MASSAGAEELAVADAGQLDGVLEGEEDAARAPLIVRSHRQDVFAFEEHVAPGDGVAGPAGDDVGECALAGAVRAHDGVHLADVYGEVEALQDLLVSTEDVQVAYFEQGAGCFPFVPPFAISRPSLRG